MKRFQSIGVLLSVITGLLVVLLVSVFAYTAQQAYDRREMPSNLLKTVDVLNDVFAAQEALRFEQGEIEHGARCNRQPVDATTRAKIETTAREIPSGRVARNTPKVERGGRRADSQSAKIIEPGRLIEKHMPKRWQASTSHWRRGQREPAGRLVRPR